MKRSPIGVFDSGIGGLTVVKRLSSTLPNESIIYFGDTARVPYGSKSNSTVIEYSIQDTKFLLQKNIKALVVACNTASSIAIPDLKKKFDIPIIGMIEPGSRLALKKSQSKKIGVIGTRATVSNLAYSKEIKKINSSAQVIEKPCPLFVPLAEEGWINHKATYEVAEEYLKELREEKIDTLVLGCTHYPILSEVIRKVIGSKVTLIDSGIASSEVIKSELEKLDLLSDSKKTGVQEYYVSDIPAKFKEVAELFLGKEIDHVHKVDLEMLISKG
ncbi:MAG: glutamate racemase [Ignavibacteriota bacterium]|nr:MAG: glutamate racemase [Chlorobiota bacterium]MBE7476168.1 glutamate racemase [Ignavibacteriales bacterium]MBL1124159.1 glutamate racemase [Ignavibacteriota bacterium]MCC7093516.1 glutamate racemase [Ignavibacteriaceae bacterium]MCE7857652.1 glutamate racemase [Ignavibacteria bacterium CHB3]MEB2297379.1 glutamate racemase [Ignavibacteria bacterium]